MAGELFGIELLCSMKGSIHVVRARIASSRSGIGGPDLQMLSNNRFCMKTLRVKAVQGN